ncbi:hypothetical protein J2T02_004325 [Chitinophaga terrae (ex Kim and Jung 2007)]|uniref:hypothetical protein n=1 Tax=Chitinophaga terrae (ex Kim and Jung 2007) TaxID=408074 RepID=UPI00277FAF3C|nr:hypothetical protein [Chitinophaga terrae (ex Kim and Jung 2007)]MDQ0109182.1 hypothetical protein [Chitinophaga terrae (ex Kim and Jung 2007)]
MSEFNDNKRHFSDEGNQKPVGFGELISIIKKVNTMRGKILDDQEIASTLGVHINDYNLYVAENKAPKDIEDSLKEKYSFRTYKISFETKHEEDDVPDVPPPSN